jgi:low temperature requirement protein LtrA
MLEKFIPKPRLITDSNFNDSRHVDWWDLFFDLYFVVIIAYLTHHVAEHPSMHSVTEFIPLFLGPCWIWVTNTVYKERFHSSHYYYRIQGFLLFTCISGFGIFAGTAFSGDLKYYILSFVMAKLVMTFEWIRVYKHDKAYAPIAKANIQVAAFTTLLMFVAIFTPKYMKYLWYVSLALDYMTPLFTFHLRAHLPHYSKSHLGERFGLLILIILGEFVAAAISQIQLTNDMLDSLELLNGLLVLMIGFSLGWLYCDNIAKRGPIHKSVLHVFAWVYIHVPLFVSLALSAALLNSIVDNAQQSAIIIYLTSVMISITIVLIGILGFFTNRRKKDYCQFINLIFGSVVLIFGILYSYQETFFLIATQIYLVMLIILNHRLSDPNKEHSDDVH